MDKRLWIICWLLLVSVGAANAQIEVADPVIWNADDLRISRPKGMTYHPGRETLFIARRDRVVEVDLEGNLLNRFSIENLTTEARGIAYDPVTENLLIVDGTALIYQVRPDGTPASRDVYLKLLGLPECDGIAVAPNSGAIWITDERNEVVCEYSRFGNKINGFVTADILREFEEAKGLAFFGDDLLIADDSAGTARVYLMSRFGALLQFVFDASDFGLEDPEAIAAIGQDRICVASSSDSKILCFNVKKSIVPQNFLALPYFTGLANGFVGLASTNTIGTDNPVEVQILTDEGQLLEQARLFDPIPAFGQTATLTHEVTQIPVASSLILRGTAGPVQSFSMMGRKDLAMLDGIGGRPPVGTELYFTAVQEATTTTGAGVGSFQTELTLTGPATTAIFLFNPSTEAASAVEVSVRDTGGVEVADETLQIESYGSFRGSLDALMGRNITLADGYIQVTSDQPLLGMSFLHNEKNLMSMAAAVSESVETLWSPHFFMQSQGGETRLRLLNLEDVVVLGTIELYSDLGVLLGEADLEVPPGALFDDSLDELLDVDAPGSVEGYFRVVLGTEDEVPQPVRVLGNVVFLGIGGNTASSLPLVSEGIAKTMFLHVAQSEIGRIFQGLAVLNPNNQTVELRIEVYDEFGDISGVVTVVLPAGSRVSGLLSDPVFFGPDFEQIKGHIRINASLPVISYSLFGGKDFLAAIQGQERIN